MSENATESSDDGTLRFTVDTHIFRELGELLVGRDSTALAELIKNSYDADATDVRVTGTKLNSPTDGSITILDNGHGMTVDAFKKGFLRVAGRQKELGDRRSPFLKRRYTGEKGIGRLAAHKLARRLEVLSVPDAGLFSKSAKAFRAIIDWDEIEHLPTLDAIVPGNPNRRPVGKRRPPALTIEELSQDEIPIELLPHGTKITLSPLRGKWSAKERLKLYREAMELQFPEPLKKIPTDLFPGKRLIEMEKKKYSLRDEPGSESAFSIDLLGDFAVGESYWQQILAQNAWLIEIDATASDKPIRCQVSPSSRAIKALGANEARQSQVFEIPRPSDACPEFFARLFIRQGIASHVDPAVKSFLRETFGVRIYVEGFRILPYGEAGNDWLRIDYDYTRRNKALSGEDFDDETDNDENAGLLIPPGRAVFGAVVMTQESSKPLRMLVNREGFVPDGAFDTMTEVMKKAINLYVRERAAVTRTLRDQNRDIRATRKVPQPENSAAFTFDRAQRQLNANLGAAREEASRAGKYISSGQVEEAENAVRNATVSLAAAASAASQVLPEQTLVRILASVGMQLGAFVHEVRGVHAMAASLRLDIERHTQAHEDELPTTSRRFLRSIHRRISDLTQSLERHASYLVDTLSADSRRRRSPQLVKTALDQSLKLVETQIARRKLKLEIAVPSEDKTPPIFAPELTLILTNLLTNAIKAANVNGKIKISSSDGASTLNVTIENTGIPIDLTSSEQWFRPFESSTSDPDPVLGRGMGMGLPITRNMIESYGGEIKFIKPTRSYKTAITFSLPKKK